MTKLELQIVRLAKRHDPKSIEKLLTRYTPVVISIMHKNGYDKSRVDDYLSAGRLAIIKAIKSYDPKYGTEFVTHLFGKVRTDLRAESKLDHPVFLTQKGKREGVELSYEEYFDQQQDHRLPTDPILAQESNQQLIKRLQTTLFKQLTKDECKVIADTYIHQKSSKELRGIYKNYKYLLHTAIKKCRLNFSVTI